MPIVFELMVLMLVAYCAGLALGWAMWGRTGADETDSTEDKGLEE